MIDACDLLKTANSKDERLHTDCPLWPYLKLYTYQTEKHLDKIAELTPEDSKYFINGFLKNLANRLMSIAQSVLVLERDVFNLSHETFISEKEFESILLQNPEYLLNILNAYPELRRLLQSLTEKFIAQSVLLARRFTNDFPAIKRLLRITGEVHLSECVISEGEMHNGNATVCTIVLSGTQKIVYKPRDLLLEDQLTKLMAWIALQAGTEYKDWQLPKYLCQDGYGWVTYVEHLPASCLSDVRLYYKRAGFLLALCTVFSISDMTSDNVIASGTSPVPIDLETAFYNVLNLKQIPKEVRWNCGQTSILPNWTWKGNDGIGVDLSALGGLKEQYVSLNLYQKLDDLKGNSKYDCDGVKIFPGANVLYLEDHAAKPWEYEDELKNGLCEAFNVLKREAPYLIEKISNFRNLSARYVPRPTATYHYALQCSLHPALLTSKDSRKKFLEDIFDNENVPAPEFLSAEVDACLNLDIPYAQTVVGSLSFVEPYHKGEGTLDPAAYTDGLSNSIDYFECIVLGNERIAFECAQIQNTLFAMQSMYDHGEPINKDSFFNPIIDEDALPLPQVLRTVESARASNKKFLSKKVSEELSSDGFWYGFHASPGGYIEYSELGEDYYYGLTGIIYGLAWINKLEGGDTENLSTLKTLSDMTLGRVLDKLENPGAHLGGFHFGLASTIIPTIIVMKHLEDSRSRDLLKLFGDYTEHALKSPFWERFFWGADLLSGMCGSLCVLVKLYEMTQIARFEMLADLLYEKLTSKINDVAGYRAFTFDRAVTTRQDGLLGGLSHGLMGCAYSLCYYNRVLKNDSTIDALVDDFLRWELSEFRSDIGNWPDYRKRSNSEEGEFCWSHGLPGNLLIIDYLATCDISRASQFLKENPPAHYFSYENLTTRKRPINDSLCHGAHGILNIIKTFNPNALNDPRIYAWSNITKLARHDLKPLRTRTADPLGLWVGKTGAVLGAMGIVRDDFNFPFLPHQMDYIE